MSQHLGITQDEFTQFARLFIEKTAHEGLSVVAVDEEQQVVGATIAEDYAQILPLVWKLSPKSLLPFLPDESLANATLPAMGWLLEPTTISLCAECTSSTPTDVWP